MFILKVAFVFPWKRKYILKQWLDWNIYFFIHRKNCFIYIPSWFISLLKNWKIYRFEMFDIFAWVRMSFNSDSAHIVSSWITKKIDSNVVSCWRSRFRMLFALCMQYQSRQTCKKKYQYIIRKCSCNHAVDLLFWIYIIFFTQHCWTRTIQIVACDCLWMN